MTRWRSGSGPTRRRPRHRAAIAGLAGASSENGDYQQAIEWYQKWLKAEPQNPDAKAGLAKAQAGLAAVQQAVPAAEQWLKLVDEGKYAESWDQTAGPFQKGMGKQAWERVGDQVRGPLGKLVSRKLKSAQYMISLPGAPDGQYVVVQFDTTFEKKKEAVETVTPMKEADGQWKVSGYFVK